MRIWNSKFTFLGIRFGWLIPVLLTLLFFNYYMPPGILIAGLLSVFLFFVSLHFFSHRWFYMSVNAMEWRVFFVSLVIRVAYMIFQYGLTYYLDFNSFPFEIFAADSIGYHEVGKTLMRAPFLEWSELLKMNMKSTSDYGYPFYQGVIYSIFGPSTVAVRLINCVIGSVTVILLGRIASIIWDDAHAKWVLINAMIFPSLVWYCGVQLKETLMLFLIVLSFYLVYAQKKRDGIHFLQALLAFLICFSLFYFRTFLAVLVLLSLILTFLPERSNKMSVLYLVIPILALIVFLGVASQTGRLDEFNAQLDDREDFFSRNLQGEKERLGNVSFDQVALAPIIFAGAIITPFPSYTYTENRQLSILSRFQNELIRNMMYFFLYIGLYWSVREYFFKSLSLIFFFVSYLIVITATGNSFQARFHMPILPLAAVFIGVGILRCGDKSRRFWSIYLAGIFLAHLAWTLFKLNIRGLDA